MKAQVVAKECHSSPNGECRAGFLEEVMPELDLKGQVDYVMLNGRPSVFWPLDVFPTDIQPPVRTSS